MDAVLADAQAADLPEDRKALFRYLEKVNDAPGTLEQADVDAARAAGCTDVMIHDAVVVCAVFNFFNRWIDGTGVPDVPAGFYERALAAGGDVGYSM